MESLQKLTFQQKVNILANLASFPSLTVMVFLRKRIGYRFLDSLQILVMTILLWIAAGFSAASGNGLSPAAFGLFGGAALIATHVGRWRRWRDIKNGVSWHTYSRGISWSALIVLRLLPEGVPINENIFKRFVDPAIVAIAGGLMCLIAPWFGYYLIFSAFCLFLFETIDYQQALNQALDVLDRMVESEVVQENVTYFQEGAEATQRPIEDTAGIATGVSPDLAAAIARRQAKQPRPAQPSPQPVTGPSSAQQPGGVSPVLDSDIIGASPPASYSQGYPPQESSPRSSRRRASLPDNLVVTDASQPSSSQPLQATPLQVQSIQAQQEIPVVQSPNDPAFAALPSGAPFMTPDGKTRWKK